MEHATSEADSRRIRLAQTLKTDESKVGLEICFRTTLTETHGARRVLGYQLANL